MNHFLNFPTKSLRRYTLFNAPLIHQCLNLNLSQAYFEGNLATSKDQMKEIPQVNPERLILVTYFRQSFNPYA